ncbi:MAG: tRNA guanosine(34) transglycosylase Tgt [Alphaproteobacteria bacterium GM202ARS2]|nr:tRNA guanosine(34) transglycosylase Tgt [Alphaproteobacteria bacterium GM202ARS2]
MTASFYTLQAQDGLARCGRLHTAHGTIDTPCFMPVATLGSVKGLRHRDILESGTQMILANTYHLMLRPGIDTIRQSGGLHNFMNWQKPILTDSGGFQVWSLAQLAKINDDGVTFRSHLDGSAHTLSPRNVIDAQYDLNSTITMPLDQCVNWDAPVETVQESVNRTCRWAEQSQKAFKKRDGYGLFAIVQGALDLEQRALCARNLVQLDLDGYAIGGLSVGEDKATREHVLTATVPLLPSNKPRYLMGVGRPLDIVSAVAQGIDMMDCVLPTRCGRTAKAFTWTGEMNLMNKQYAQDFQPLDATCPCPTCRDHHRSYLHHLFKSKEMLAATLLTLHNVVFYQQLMARLRQAICDGNVTETAHAIENQMKTLS